MREQHAQNNNTLKRSTAHSSRAPTHACRQSPKLATQRSRKPTTCVAGRASHSAPWSTQVSIAHGQPGPASSPTSSAAASQRKQPPTRPPPTERTKPLQSRRDGTASFCEAHTHAPAPRTQAVHDWATRHSIQHAKQPGPARDTGNQYPRTRKPAGAHQRTHTHASRKAHFKLFCPSTTPPAAARPGPPAARGQVGSRKHVPPWVEEERGKKRKSDTALTDGDHGDHPCGGSGQWARA